MEELENKLLTSMKQVIENAPPEMQSKVADMLVEMVKPGGIERLNEGLKGEMVINTLNQIIPMEDEFHLIYLIGEFIFGHVYDLERLVKDPSLAGEYDKDVALLKINRILVSMQEKIAQEKNASKSSSRRKKK